MAPVDMSADPSCAALHAGGADGGAVVVAPGGGLANVFVWLKSGVPAAASPAEPAAPPAPVVLDQLGCIFTPRVIAVRPGQGLLIRNSDDTLHNTHARPGRESLNREFNIGQPRKGQEAEKRFDAPQLMIPIGCDVHPWMRAYVSVVDHPYFAVTRSDGTFEIEGVPPGTYEIEVMHEVLAGQVRRITVEPGRPAHADFTLGPRKKTP